MILVGHSYGSVITAAGTDDRVAGLVYIAALAPDADETSQGQQDKFPTTDVFQFVEVAGGRAWMLPEGVGCFAGDLSEEEQGIVWSTHFACGKPVPQQRAGRRLEDEAELVHRGRGGPDGPPGARALRRQAHEREDHRDAVEPRRDALAAGPRVGRDPRRGQRCPGVLARDSAAG